VSADAARVESAKSGLAGDQAALAVTKTNYDRATLHDGLRWWPST
jgi:hypothetical protein